ncbi:hypothetical protein ACQ86N_10950 [Puia sp. P3]|uniref:hypothetical protein n=1 Tax=Puia sp. P3 TaxID=3423952 RepID=UPI003D666F9E
MGIKGQWPCPAKRKNRRPARPPQKSALIRLPARITPDAPEELYLDLHYYYHKPGSRPLRTSSPETHLLLHPWTGSLLPVKPSGDLTYTDSNGLFTIQSPAPPVRFDKQTGWLQSYTSGDCQLMRRYTRLQTPALAGFHNRPPIRSCSRPAPAASSSSSGRNIHLPETSSLLHLSYTVNAAGEILVEQSLSTDTSKQGPPLPLLRNVLAPTSRIRLPVSIRPATHTFLYHPAIA